MNKEQFLAIGLSHKLKCKRTFFDEEELGKENGICEIDGFDYHIYKEGGIFDLTPICHNLSDLTKPITHNGETFVPMLKMVDEKNTEWEKMEAVEYNPFNMMEGHHKWYKVVHETLGEIISINPKNILVLPFYLVEMLISWHFDIAGLIEKGEAIDVNTLSENPYK